MRLIGTYKNTEAAHRLSQTLTSKGIENKCEDASITDWGSAEYGDRFCRLWIIDEDRLQEALSFSQAYEQQPETHITPIAAYEQPDAEMRASLKRRLEGVQQGAAQAPGQPLGPITLYLILICSLLYFWSVLESPPHNAPGIVPRTAVVASPIRRALLYDYPKAYEVLDQFATLAEQSQWKTEAEITPEGHALMEQFSKTPFWHGFYAVAVQVLKGAPWRPLLDDPRFEKMHEGEVWRVLTPVLLHSDLLHIAFNMLWLMVLGKQMEPRLGKWRYLLFCVIVGIFSNTVQYLMSGPNFIGFSGILCGMLAYIWVRQKKAPWEGYQLQSGTYMFLTVFVLAMLALQLTSFIGEIYWNQAIASGIANTAHFSGALAGFALGHVRYFALR